MLLAGLLPAEPASATSNLADLAVSTTVDPAEVVHTGGMPKFTVDLTNSGSRQTQEIVLTFSLPEGSWIPGDGVPVPESWHCDLAETASCVHDGLAAGAVAERIEIPIGIPPGTVGEVVDITVSVWTSTPEVTHDNNTHSSVVRYVQGTVDLVVEGPMAGHDVIVGEEVRFGVNVRNEGTSPSGDVTVTGTLPDEMRWHTPFGEGLDWECSFVADPSGVQSKFQCLHRGLLPGQGTERLVFSAMVTSGDPGTAMTVMVDADNSIPETSLDNNRVQPTYTVVQPATIRGIVWVDRDWDHVRDAEEIGAPVGGQGIRWILAFSQQGDVPSMQATLNPDGTYVAKVRPGSFVVEFIIGDPYEFTSSADSDLASYNNTSGYEHYGYSGVLVLSGGDEVVVDAAVVRR